MKHRIIAIGIVGLACLALAAAAQDSRQDSRQDDTARKIDSLSRALDAERRKTAALEHRVDQIESWLVSIRSAADALDAATEEARKGGFIPAGANPGARAALLDGIKGFAAGLAQPAPPVGR